MNRPIDTTVVSVFIIYTVLQIWIAIPAFFFLDNSKIQNTRRCVKIRFNIKSAFMSICA